jgi:LysM repeat protein
MKRITATLIITAIVLLGIIPVAAAADDTVTINVNNLSSYEYSMLFLQGTTLVKDSSAHAHGWVSFSGPAGLYEYFIDRVDGFSFHGYVNIAAGSTTEFRLETGPTVAPVLSMTTATTVSATPPSPTSYIVQAGDKLVDIAQVMGVTPEFLAAANHIANANAISVVQVLYSDRYTVHTGDTLSQIASKLGVSADSLAAVNNLSDRNFLSNGHVLTIPRA